MQKKDVVARFPQGPLPEFTPLHLQSASSPLSSSRPVWKRSRLLSLPAEIRLLIYEHIFTSETIPSDSLDFKSVVPYQRVTASTKGRFLLTCRKIAEEATPVLYAQHTFCFRHAYRIFRFKHTYIRDLAPSTTNLPTPRSVFGTFPRARLAMLAHVSVSYFLDNDSADKLNDFDFWSQGSSADTGILDEHLTELVRIFRKSCPRMKSFTLEMASGSSPHLLQNYCTADIEISGRGYRTGEFGRSLGYKVLEELRQMSCLEGGSLQRLRLVAVTEAEEAAKTQQIVGAGNKRWHELGYFGTDDEPVWVELVDKDFKKDGKKVGGR